MNKLDPKALGLACGILWAIGILFMGLTAMFCPWSKVFVDALGIMYVGYSATVIGTFIGIVWGFIDAAIGGFLIAWLYNKLLKTS